MHISKNAAKPEGMYTESALILRRINIRGQYSEERRGHGARAAEGGHVRVLKKEHTRIFLIMISRLLGFGPGGYPSHAYFSNPSKNKYIVKPHLTLIRFRASGLPISRNSHRMIKVNFKMFPGFFTSLLAAELKRTNWHSRSEGETEHPYLSDKKLNLGK